MINKNTSNSPTLSEASAISSNTLINVEEDIIDTNNLINKTNLYNINSYSNDSSKINDKYGKYNKQRLYSFIPSKRSIKLGLLCIGWYCATAIHSNIQKKILKEYKHPITITYIQFFGVIIYSILSHLLKFTKLQKISLDIIKQTLPLGAFQICGHLLNSFALSLVSVSFVQTIKALSPLFIVCIYKIFFNVNYSKQTYISLMPLTFGVMLVCINKTSFNIIGFLCAFFSCLIFALQNIFTKKVLSNTKSKSKKLDKFNVLFFFSLQAFILLTPMWYTAEGYTLFKNSNVNVMNTTDDSIGSINNQGTESADNIRLGFDNKMLLFNIILNSLVHYLQSTFAFTIINFVNPVTYSIAGLVKRIFVILVSLVFFGDSITLLQSIGITVTFIGLYLYNKAKNEKINNNSNKTQNNQINTEVSFREEYPMISTHTLNSRNVLPISNKEILYSKEN